MTTRWRKLVPERKKIVMWGAGDQGRVNLPILCSLGCEIAAFVDETPGLAAPVSGVVMLRNWDGLASWLMGQDVSTLGFIVAIGNPYGHVRLSLHERMAAAGLAPASMVDESARLCATSHFGEGLQAMPQVIVNNNATIGRQCILNTRCLVEHDCVLDDGVELAPAATLCGRVHVGENSWIGAGATVRPRVRIGKNVIIGAGACVVSDIPDNVVAVGVPANPIEERKTPSAVADAG